MVKPGRQKCPNSPYWNLREWNLLLHCKIMLVLMQKLKCIWSFLQIKRLQYSMTLQRLTRKSRNTIDTGIQLKNHEMYQKDFKQGFITKAINYNICNPFTIDKDTHCIGYSHCWVNRCFFWNKVLSVFQASIKIISIYYRQGLYVYL